MKVMWGVDYVTLAGVLERRVESESDGVRTTEHYCKAMQAGGGHTLRLLL